MECKLLKEHLPVYLIYFYNFFVILETTRKVKVTVFQYLEIVKMAIK